MAKCGECRFFGKNICNVNNANCWPTTSACSDFADNSGSNEKYCKNCRFFTLKICSINNANRWPTNKGCINFVPFKAVTVNESSAKNYEKIEASKEEQKENEVIPEKKELSGKEYEKIKARVEYFERLHSIEIEMVQEYLLTNKEKKLVEKIILMRKQNLVKKTIVSIISFCSIFVFYEINLNIFFSLIIIGMWICLFKIFNKNMLKKQLAVSESAIETEIEINYKLLKWIKRFDPIVEEVSVYNSKILDYINSEKGKDWIKNVYNA